MENLFLQGQIVTKVINVRKITVSPCEGISAEPRQFCGLVYFFDGESRYRYGDKYIDTTSGSIIFLPRGVRYTIERKTPSSLIYIDFLTDKDQNDPFSLPSSLCGSAMAELFRFAHNSSKARDISSEAELFSIVYKIISFIRRAQFSGVHRTEHMRRLSPAVNYMEENFCDPSVRLEKYAALCGISTRYFTKLFSACYGVSPQEYVISLRIDRACDMLSQTDEPVGIIAEECGFSDIFYFSKIFRKVTGITPTKYRRNTML